MQVVRLENTLQKKQYGFMPGRGTSYVIFILRMLRTIQMQKDLFVCSIDYEKAFDNVRHAQLFQDLEEMGLDRKDLRLLGPK